MVKDYKDIVDLTKAFKQTEEIPSPCFSILRLKQDNQPDHATEGRKSAFFLEKLTNDTV